MIRIHEGGAILEKNCNFYLRHVLPFVVIRYMCTQKHFQGQSTMNHGKWMGLPPKKMFVFIESLTI